MGAKLEEHADWVITVIELEMTHKQYVDHVVYEKATSLYCGRTTSLRLEQVTNEKVAKLGANDTTMFVSSMKNTLHKLCKQVDALRLYVSKTGSAYRGKIMEINKRIYAAVNVVNNNEAGPKYDSVSLRLRHITLLNWC